MWPFFLEDDEKQHKSSDKSSCVATNNIDTKVFKNQLIINNS